MNPPLSLAILSEIISPDYGCVGKAIGNPRFVHAYEHEKQGDVFHILERRPGLRGRAEIIEVKHEHYTPPHTRYFRVRSDLPKEKCDYQPMLFKP
jgi:hypothetical protein